MSDFAPPQYYQIIFCTESMRVTELHNTFKGVHVSRLFLLALQDRTVLRIIFAQSFILTKFIGQEHAVD